MQTIISLKEKRMRSLFIFFGLLGLGVNSLEANVRLRPATNLGQNGCGFLRPMIEQVIDDTSGTRVIRKRTPQESKAFDESLIKVASIYLVIQEINWMLREFKPSKERSAEETKVVADLQSEASKLDQLLLNWELKNGYTNNGFRYVYRYHLSSTLYDLYPDESKASVMVADLFRKFEDSRLPKLTQRTVKNGLTLVNVDLTIMGAFYLLSLLYLAQTQADGIESISTDPAGDLHQKYKDLKEKVWGNLFSGSEATLRSAKRVLKIAELVRQS
jgi:hypothetical protein